MKKVFGIREVLSHGLCVGCGACAVVSPTIKLSRDRYGAMQAELPESLDANELDRASSVCPFSDHAPNEDSIAGEVWPEVPLLDSRIGRYIDLFAGRVNQPAYLMGSSSGGLTSWLCAELLSRDLIDGVVHVGSTRGSNDGLYEYQVSYSLEELKLRRKSQYYSVSADSVLQKIRGDGRRYAFVGVPCFVKSVRAVTKNDERLKEQIKFLIGLVCGHMKTSAFAELMAWQVGVKPNELAAVDFRVKNPEQSASRYDFTAVSVSGEHAKRRSNQLVGGNWGHATMQLNACNFCDDIFAETADVAFGDAWIPKYESAWQGTNVVVSRNGVVSKILQEGRSDSRIFLEESSANEIASSQDGNFRHRREGLALRLADDDEATRPRPKKRVDASASALNQKRKAIVRLRREMGNISHQLFFEAKTGGSLSIYTDGMRECSEKMDKLSKRSLFARISKRLVRVFGL